MNFFGTQTLTYGSVESPRATLMNSISFESPCNSLMLQYLVKSLAALLRSDSSIQSILTYVVFI